MYLTLDTHNTYVYTGGKTLSAEQSASQPAIVFIHGAEQDHSCWTLQSRWFAHHGYTTLVPDLPGHGRSSGAPLASVEAIADWIITLLDSLAIQKAILVGHSLGSLIVIDTAIGHAERVAKAVLITPSLPMPVSDVLLDAAQHNEPKAAAMINDFSHSPRAQFGGNTVPGMWMMGINQRLMERQKAGVFHTDLAACHAYLRPLDSLAAITCPTLILAGSRDRMTSPKIAGQLAATIPGARLLTLDGGHALMAEQPDALLDALQGFVLGA